MHDKINESRPRNRPRGNDGRVPSGFPSVRHEAAGLCLTQGWLPPTLPGCGVGCAGGPAVSQCPAAGSLARVQRRGVECSPIRQC